MVSNNHRICAALTFSSFVPPPLPGTAPASGPMLVEVVPHRVLCSGIQGEHHLGVNTAKIALSGWSVCSVGTTLRRNTRRKMKRVHTAAGQRLVRILEKPKTIVAVFDHSGRDNGPLPYV